MTDEGLCVPQRQAKIGELRQGIQSLSDVVSGLSMEVVELRNQLLGSPPEAMCGGEATPPSQGLIGELQDLTSSSLDSLNMTRAIIQNIQSEI